MGRKRQAPITKAEYHTKGGDYRNIAVPNTVHKRIAHIAIDLERSVSEIVTELIEEYCFRHECRREEKKGVV